MISTDFTYTLHVIYLFLGISLVYIKDVCRKNNTYKQCCQRQNDHQIPTGTKNATK